MENLVADNPASEVVDNPLTAEPAANGAGTGNPGGQAPGATPTDDLFKGVDPNRLPPEVKAHYDSMLRDYREKTAKLSETIKAETAKSTESYRSKAEFYDQLAAQESFVKQWNEYVEKAKNTVPGDANSDPKLTQMEQKLQEVTQKMQMAELHQATDAFADAIDEKGAKLRPEFDQLNSLSVGQIQGSGGVEDFSLLRACVELAGGKNPSEKLANGYKAAKATYDSIFELGKKAGMGRVQTKVMNGTNPPANAGSDALVVTDRKPKSAREALEMARKGITVSRD